MWILRLVLGSVLIGALVADVQKDFQKCQEGVNMKVLEDMTNNLEEQELETVCPMVLDFMDCVENVIKTHLNYTLAELAADAPDPNVKKGATIILNIRNLFIDLCTEGSDLNTEYQRHSSCMSKIDVLNECIDDAVTIYNAYKKLEENLEVEVNYREKECFVTAYRLACVSTQLHDECGQGAFDLFQQLIKRSSIFRLALCSEEDLGNLKTKFLDSLELEEYRHNLFQQAFDLRKRKK